MVRIALSPRALSGTGYISFFFSLVLGFLVVARPVSAADVLLVSDSSSGGGIAAVLMADGHSVTSVTGDFALGNVALKAPLGAYDVVYWIANGSGSGSRHDDASVFTNLSSYVMGGGRVFVAGYDSVASPADPMLISFLGASNSTDGPGSPGPVAMVENSLTTGLVDIRGVTPSGGSGDRDGLTGLTATTVSVMASSGTSTTSQWVLRPLGSGEIAYVSNGDSTGTHASWSNTVTGGAGAYNAALRNFAQAAESASADPGAPEITFDWPSSLDEGGALTLVVAIDDLEGDSYTFSWDLDDDGTFGEMAGMTSYTIAAGTTDGPDSLRLAVEAVDASGNTARRSRALRIVNVAPTITSEAPAVTGIGGELRYALVATDPAGAADPLTYRMIQGPDGASVDAAGVFTWTPDATDVTMGVETVRIELEVSDGDGGLTTQLWEMTVLPNVAPEAGGLVYPIAGVVLAEREPRLVVQNGDDADLDPLTYYFELDTVDTFDSPALRESGPLPEMPGLTYWYPGDLGQDVYYWRAWVSDGIAVTAPQETTFQVYLGELEPVDGGLPGDGGAIDGGAGDSGASADGGPAADAGERERDRGCSVSGSAAGAGGSSPWSFAFWFAGLAAFGLVRRQRRQRLGRQQD